MTISQHAIQRFQERVTNESPEFIRLFIISDIQSSTFLYSVEDIATLECNGITYIVDYRNASNPFVRTVYLSA
ncbi:hypothetical protein [Planococcus donghaensis]|uniref:Uncharacterized protein n=1 Tax=Planococcus donghaensis TaxID=414778 RepID=A0A1C7EDZ3_9BACL|nr:hypothetical protein [Planococcus donghaensis]ANU21999.1 hypothetical protein BCM40_01000 [Planococcus donghaensis]